MSESSAEYRALMDRSQDEIDILTITPMLNTPPPMSWATYCEIFVSAIESNTVYYPNMYKRYKDLVRAHEEKKITHEQFSQEKLVYAVEGTSRYLARILRFDAVMWFTAAQRQAQTWDGFVSVLDLMSESRLAYNTLSDPRFLAFILQNVKEQRYSATVRQFDRTDSLMVFVRAGYGLSVTTRSALSPDLSADRPIVNASDMPTLALSAHDWDKLESIIANGLEKRTDRSEIHLAVAVPQQGIKDIPVLKNGRCIVFVDTLALFAHYQCSLYSNEERSVLLVHADRILPEHFQAVIDKYNNKEQRGVAIPPVVRYFLGRRDQPLPREIQTMTYLPPQAKLLLKNIQTANQMMLANSARMEEDFQQRSDPIVVETVFQADALEVLVNSEMAHQIVDRALDSDDGPVSSAYRLEGGHREFSGAEVIDDEGLTSSIVGPSIEAPPIN